MQNATRGLLALSGAALVLAGVGGAMLLAEPKPAPQAPVAAAETQADEPLQTVAESEARPAAPAPQASAAPAPESPFVIRRILPITGPIKYGEWHWDEEGAPDGPIVITVDLDARVLSIFRNGYEIGATAVLLGTEDKPTPTGVFPITQKRRHHVSNLYDAEMPYMQRLTNDGITLHGSKVEWGYASHGCIGMPEPFAAKVFAQTRIGDRVFITRGKTVGIGDSLVDS